MPKAVVLAAGEIWEDMNRQEGLDEDLITVIEDLIERRRRKPECRRQVTKSVKPSSSEGLC